MTDPIFQSQLPNAYNSPLNFGSYGAGPESSGWNVNSAYLTPTFMAGYRPNYGGPQNMSMPYMGFWRGANVALPTPWQPDTPYYMDAAQYRTAGFQAAGNKAMDVAMTGAQFAAGIAISAGVGSFLSNKNFFTKAAGFGEMAMGGNSMGRMGASMGKGAGHVMSLAARGAAGAVGWVPLVGPAASGALRGAAAMMPGIGGMAGAFTGGMLLPFTAGLAAAEVANQAIFTPYVAGRQGADVVSNYFRGMGTGLGTSSDPLSVSSFNANRIGFSLSSAFSRDLSWKPDTGAQTLQFGLQEGLYKNLSGYNANTITKRTKEIANQVKLVMDAFNEPSMQEAIKMLGQLSTQGGLTGTAGVAQLSQRYKMASIATGIGSRELMGTVGMQGQMMYGQAGLVPVLGQMAALNAITGISAAHKSGLINTATLAMMGGLEGASQLAMQANMGLAGSQYNRMTAYLQYAGGVGPGGLTNNLANFGNMLASGNPLKAYAAFGMNADKAVSAQLANDPTQPLRRVFEQAEIFGDLAKNSKGQYDAGVLHALMMQSGSSPQQAEALLRQYQGLTSPGYMRKYTANARAESQSAMEKALEQEGLLYAHTGLGYAYYQTRAGFRNIQGTFSDWNREDMEKLGLMGDAVRDMFFDEFSGAATRTGQLKVNTDMSDRDFLLKTRKVKSVTGREIHWMAGATAENRAGRKVGRGGSSRNYTGIDAISGFEGGFLAQRKYTKLINDAENEALNDPAKGALLVKARSGKIGAADVFALKEAFGFASEEEAKNFVSAYSTATIKTIGEKEVESTELGAVRTNLLSAYGNAVDEFVRLNPYGKDYADNWASVTKDKFSKLTDAELSTLNSIMGGIISSGTNITEENAGEVIKKFTSSKEGRDLLVRMGRGDALADTPEGIEAAKRAMSDLRIAGVVATTTTSGIAYGQGRGAKTQLEQAKLIQLGLAQAEKAGIVDFKGMNMVAGNLTVMATKNNAKLRDYKELQTQYDAAGNIDFSGMMNVFLERSGESANNNLTASIAFKEGVRAFITSVAPNKVEEIMGAAAMAAQGEMSGAYR